MEEDFFYQDYLNWRKSGVESSKIKDLINLHFYFRELKKLGIKAIYQEHFSETASERESGLTEFQLFNKQTSTSDEEISLEFNDSSSPVIAIESSSPDLIYVLMPMRV